MSKFSKNQQAAVPVKAVGERAEVFVGTALRTRGGLVKSDLKMNAQGRIVSIRASEAAAERYLQDGPLRQQSAPTKAAPSRRRELLPTPEYDNASSDDDDWDDEPAPPRKQITKPIKKDASGTVSASRRDTPRDRSDSRREEGRDGREGKDGREDSYIRKEAATRRRR
jgi:hypothetical protein